MSLSTAARSVLRQRPIGYHPAQRVAMRFKGPLYTHLVDRSDVAPTCAAPRFVNSFIYQTAKEHQAAIENRAPWPKVKFASDLVPMWHGDPHQCMGFTIDHVTQSYLPYRSPTFPRVPDAAAGELVSGATLTRTKAWVMPGEPAVQAVARYEPGNIRPFGYAENVPMPDTATPENVATFDHARLPTNHADRRPWNYFVAGVGMFVLLGSVRGVCVRAVRLFWPNKSVWASAVIEVKLDDISPGQNLVVQWTGKPVFVRNRTPEMIAASIRDDAIASSMRDPAKDADRVQKQEWLVCLGICTHLGCIPFADQGDWGGYFCPCHGSHYDHAGRIRKGPAPYNLELPAYSFPTGSLLQLGS